MIIKHQLSARIGQPLKLLICVSLAVIMQGMTIAVYAQSSSNPSGQPLPRFVTTRSNPVNVRVGPGRRYDVSWIFVKAGQPVEIIQEFDTWRKVRDVDGDEGWVHQSLLSPNRAAFIKHQGEAENVALRARRDQNAEVRAWLGDGFAVEVSACDGQWCSVRAQHRPAEGRAVTYNGYIAQSALWGVYAQEIFK